MRKTRHGCFSLAVLDSSKAACPPGLCLNVCVSVICAFAGDPTSALKKIRSASVFIRSGHDRPDLPLGDFLQLFGRLLQSLRSQFARGRCILQITLKARTLVS